MSVQRSFDVRSLMSAPIANRKTGVVHIHILALLDHTNPLNYNYVFLQIEFKDTGTQRQAHRGTGTQRQAQRTERDRHRDRDTETGTILHIEFRGTEAQEHADTETDGRFPKNCTK